jgi:hypothetical protein
MEHIHHDVDSHVSYPDLVSGFDSAINDWSDWTVRDSAREGQYVDVEYVPGTDVEGTRVSQDDGGTFQPRDEEAVLSIDLDVPGIPEYWVVTPGKNRVRDFSMEVDRSQLGGTSLLDLEVESFLLGIELGAGGGFSLGDPPFTVGYDVNDDGDLDHSFAIYQANSGPNDVNITYANQVTGETRTCTVEDADETFTVDVSNGRVEGADGACRDVFAFQSEIEDPYQMLFIEGEQIGGNYEFVVDTSTSSFRSGYDSDGELSTLLSLDLTDLIESLTSFPSDPDFLDYFNDHPSDADHDDSYSPASPYIEPAIYSANVSLDYQSDSMSYESNVTVAPNEP